MVVNRSGAVNGSGRVHRVGASEPFTAPVVESHSHRVPTTHRAYIRQQYYPSCCLLRMERAERDACRCSACTPGHVCPRLLTAAGSPGSAGTRRAAPDAVLPPVGKLPEEGGVQPAFRRGPGHPAETESVLVPIDGGTISRCRQRFLRRPGHQSLHGVRPGRPQWRNEPRNPLTVKAYGNPATWSCVRSGHLWVRGVGRCRERSRILHGCVRDVILFDETAAFRGRHFFQPV